MTIQRTLFDDVKLEAPEPTTTVRLGPKSVQIPLRKRRRKAVERLMEILEELEGKDIYIGSGIKRLPRLQGRGYREAEQTHL